MNKGNPMNRKPKLNGRTATLICYALAVGAVLGGSCSKKEKLLDDQPKLTTPVPQFPQPADADAVLVALKSSVPSPVSLPSIPGMPSGSEISIELGMGIALLKDNAKAGQVLLNNTELKFTNGVHMWMPDFQNLTNPQSFTGIDLNGQITWNVTNPNIQKTISSLPGRPAITSGKTVTRSSGYTFTNQFASGAQKIMYAIYSDNNKYILKEVNGSSTSVTFSAAELAALGSTKTGILQANAYSISNEVIGGKKVYFVKQNSYSVAGVQIN